MSVLCSIRSGVDCPFVRCFKEVKYKKDLSTIVLSFKGPPLPKIGPSLFVLRRPSRHLYIAEHFDYWLCKCDFELRLRCHA